MVCRETQNLGLKKLTKTTTGNVSICIDVVFTGFAVIS
jgi:hypothetical protein